MGSGNDIFYGNESPNVFFGNAGNDNAYGYGGNDALSGGEGNDFLRGDEGADNLIGGQGSDVLKAVDYSSVDTLIGGDRADENRHEDTDIAYYDLVTNDLDYRFDALFGIDYAYQTITNL